MAVNLPLTKPEVSLFVTSTDYINYLDKLR